MASRSFRRIYGVLAGACALSLILLFQNCGGDSRALSKGVSLMSEGEEELQDPQIEEDQPSSATTGPRLCSFDEQDVAPGESVTAYKESVSGSCQSEARVCDGDTGRLSGSFQFPKCTVVGKKSCQLDGKVIAHGGTLKAYHAKTVIAPTSCDAVSQTGTCNDGQWVGLMSNMIHSSCSVRETYSCTYGKYTLKHNEYINVSIYKPENASPIWFNAQGIFCQFNARQCRDGVMWKVRLGIRAQPGYACGNPLIGGPTSEPNLGVSYFRQTDNLGSDLPPTPYRLTDALVPPLLTSGE